MEVEVAGRGGGADALRGKKGGRRENTGLNE